MMKHITHSLITGIVVLTLLAALPQLAWAQTGTEKEKPAFEVGPLALTTAFPNQTVEMGENVSIDLKLRTSTEPQIARLEVTELPEGWEASFRGGAKVISAAYVEPGTDTNITLRLEPSDTIKAGTYRFVVRAKSERAEATLPLEITVQEKLPPSLSLTVDLPTLRGKPNTTFRYNATLKNEGDENLAVNLIADAPPGFIVTFKTAGQEVTSVPLDANQSKSLSVEARAFPDLPAGSYPITVRAEGGEARATLNLTAEVTGEADLTVTAPDERLSGTAYAGSESPLKVIIRNTGSAPARAITLSSSEPAGWSVEFVPKEIDEIPAGQQAEVTAKIRPSDKALAGDYIVTVRAQPTDGSTKSADFRITVLTTTLWGVVGVVLIAVAVGVVAIAVLRFGRR
jgi:uncharacterized membrane protein